MTREALREQYQERLGRFVAEKERASGRSRRVALARAVVFILLVTLAIRFFSSNPWLGILLPLLLLVVFLWLVRESVTIAQKLQYLGQLIRIQREEIQSLDFDFTPFPEGNEFIDYHHPYAWDLDIFGKHSLFRMLSRTGTGKGHTQLAGELLNPETDGGVILRRQEAIREMAANTDGRHRFLALARMVDETEKHAGLLGNWLAAPDRYRHNRVVRILLWILPVTSFLLPFLFILFSSFSPLPFALFLYYLIPLGLVLFESRVITAEHNRVSELLKLFRKYQGLLEWIEQEPMQSDYLKGLRQGLFRDGVPASRITRQLARIVWGLEARMNLIMAFILNAFVLWDLRYMLRLEEWRGRHGSEFEGWLNIIGRFEVLCSLANFSANRSDCTYPEIRSGSYILDMKGAGHPLMDPRRRVDNDLSIQGMGQIYLITGANMAGKSTLLRTAGVNLVLAMTGAPVCSASMAFTPAKIMTSVRTHDSLGDDESYFYAELKKLSAIIRELERGDPLFVIVDEMLRGTNSKDKHTGSEALIRKLIRMGAYGMVATHDVELGRLAEEYPTQVYPVCFEVALEGNQLHFDYLLRPGISRSLNATFLMKNMGIIDHD